ncbi:DNA gyrase inhibitor YacG [Rhodovastum atsumiense]|uniref:DNA gyrase inhibitor YacG n=1 Tax=Rhodovastum atsumiense TaxID=504468 RepID=A0A5M6J583_9PROT|nr:DNA gyrase inhibitor YacG [Rhodovastum atsumiense]KAA5614758.1 DNA gyrase inhibitor YacG [Rhodovastum atsumiense]CAH2599693.1 DNA gyrase inhibitor YacG [Rhodovastum atsumiense]
MTEPPFSRSSVGPAQGVASPCPLCGKPAQPKFRPFCSARCADIDLGRWFNESYRIPAQEPSEERDESSDLPG